jgi:putative phosphoesterase
VTTLGLIADTQGRYDLSALLSFLASAFREVDEIWHGGDWGRQPEVLQELAALKPLVVVRGNDPDDPRFPLRVERQMGRRRVGMVHNLAVREHPWAASFDILIHAHSHRWRDETVGGTRFINPGTATRPQFGGTERTIGLLRLRSDVTVKKILVPRFGAGKHTEEVKDVRISGRGLGRRSQPSGARRI